MLTVEIDEANGIALFKPEGKLTENDFKSAAQRVNHYLDQHDKLNGLIIHTREFPGWDSFSALLSHLKFVKEHHRKISSVAIATDSFIGSLAENVANHFVKAKIKRFSFDELGAASQWIRGQSTTKN